MKVLNWPRASGKTTQLLRWWVEDPMHRQIVVGSASRRSMILGLLVADYGHVFQRPFLEKAVINASGVSPTTRLRAQGVTLAIDELDDVLHALFGRPVEIVTLTAEDVPPPVTPESCFPCEEVKPC